MAADTYLLENQPSELGRLQLQSRVWEPAGQRLLDQLGDGARVIDIGCGALGWLRLLSGWVGPDGEVIGTDIDDNMLNAAGQFVASEGLDNVTLVRDDLFASQLEPSSWDRSDGCTNSWTRISGSSDPVARSCPKNSTTSPGTSFRPRRPSASTSTPRWSSNCCT